MPKTIDYLNMEVRDHEELSSKWGWNLAFGIILVAAGVLALSMTAMATIVSVALIGSFLLVAGIIQLVQAFFSHKWSGFFLRLLVGTLYGIVGFVMLTKPGFGALSLTWMIGVLFLSLGVFKSIYSVVARFDSWGWSLFSGIISLLLGALVLAEWPANSFWVIGTFVGIDLIFDGLSLVMLGFALHNPGARTRHASARI